MLDKALMVISIIAVLVIVVLMFKAIMKTVK